MFEETCATKVREPEITQRLKVQSELLNNLEKTVELLGERLSNVMHDMNCTIDKLEECKPTEEVSSTLIGSTISKNNDRIDQTIVKIERFISRLEI